MIRINSIFTAALSAAFVFSAGAYASTWEIDPAHAEAKFEIRHMGLSNVSGTITGIKGTFDIDDKDAKKVKIEATADATTINTNNADRDKHLKNADFFDTTKYPSITFKSKKITTEKGGKLKIVGDLTLHGQTKEVTMDAEAITPAVKDMWGNNRRGFTATTKITRKDFGLVWNKTLETGGVMLGETAKVDINAELIQPTAAAKGKEKS